MNATLTTLSPTIIKAPDEVSRSLVSFGTYTSKTGKEQNVVYRISLEKLMAVEPINGIQPIDLIMQKAEQPTKPIPVLSGMVCKNHDYKVLRITNDAKETHQYFETMHTNGKSYVPGSSIKGAILTAVINYTVESLHGQNPSFQKWIDQRIASVRNPKKDGPKLTEALIGIAKDFISGGQTSKGSFKFTDNALQAFNKKRFEPWIAISDTDAQSPGTRNLTATAYRVKQGNGRGGINTEGIIDPINIESIKPKQNLEFRIIQQKPEYDINTILDITAKHFNNVLEEERKWYEARKIKIDLPSAQTPGLIRLGWGSGLDAFSILPAIRNIGDPTLLDTYTQKWKLTKNLDDYPNSKWVAWFDAKSGTKFLPYGWCTISVQKP